MKELLNTFRKGMALDTADLSQPQDTYQQAWNWVRRKEHAHGELSSEPLYQSLSVAYQAKYPGGKVIYSLPYRESESLLFVSYQGNYYPVLLQDNMQCRYFSGSLPYSSAVKVLAVIKSETCYFTDGVNPPMYLDLSTSSDNKLHEIFTQRAFFSVSIRKLPSQGNLVAGRYFLYYRLTDRKAYTAWHLAGKIDLSDNSTKDGDLSSGAISLTLGKVTASTYPYLELAIVSFLDQDRQEVYRISRRYENKAGSSQEFVITGSEARDPVTIAELLAPQVGLKTAKVIHQKDSHLLLGNITIEPYDDLQAYFNKCKLRYDLYSGSGFAPTFQSGEVYAFAARVLYQDGRISPPFHIPGSGSATEARQLKGVATAFTYPDGFNTANLSNSKVYHHRMPYLNDTGGFVTFQVTMYNLSLPVSIKSKIAGIELLYASREGQGEVVASGFLFNTRGKLSYNPNDGIVSQTDTGTVFEAVYPANAEGHSAFDGKDYLYLSDFDLLSYSNENHGKEALSRKLFTFFSPDTTLHRPAMRANAVRIEGEIQRSAPDTAQYHQQFHVYDLQNPIGIKTYIDGTPRLVGRQEFDLQEAVYVDSNADVHQTGDFDFYKHSNFWRFNNRYQEACVLLQSKLPVSLVTDRSYWKGGNTRIPYVQLLSKSDYLYGPVEQIAYESHGDIAMGSEVTQVSAYGDITQDFFGFYRQNLPRKPDGSLDTRSSAYLGHIAYLHLRCESRYNQSRIQPDKEAERYFRGKIMMTMDEYEDGAPQGEATVAGKAFLGFKPYNYYYSNQSFRQGKELQQVVTALEELTYPVVFANRLYYSGKDLRETERDAYLEFLSDNYTDIPEDKGKLTGLFTQNNRLYAHMQGGIYNMFMQPQQIRTDEASIVLGTADLFSIPPQDEQQATRYYAGLSDAHHALQTRYGYFFADTVNRRLFRVTDKLEEISLQGVRDLLATKTIIPVLGYDERYRRLLFSGIDSSTLSYDCETGVWVSRHEYNPQHYLHLQGRTIRIKDTQWSDMNTVNGYAAVRLDVVVNQEPFADKSFQALKYYTEGPGKMTELQVFTERYQSRLQALMDHVPLTVRRDDGKLMVRKLAGYSRVSIPGAIPLPGSATLSTLAQRMKGRYLKISLQGAGEMTLYHLITDYKDNIR